MHDITHICLRCVLSFLVVCSLFCGGARAQDLPEKKIVLVLQGLGTAGAWEQQFNSSLYKEMTGDQDVPTALIFEFLGLEHLPDDPYPQHILEHLRHKTEILSIDLVVAVLPAAGTERYSLFNL